GPTRRPWPCPNARPYAVTEALFRSLVTRRTILRPRSLNAWPGQLMWQAKNKRDLMIEVWEKLDCESVGSVEIEAIEEVVRDVYGESAVESPMRIARLLADEGAELRHSEIMELYVRRYEARPYTAEFRNILKTGSLRQTLSSIRNLENLRKKFVAEGDKNGLRLIRERVIEAKKKLMATPMEK